MSLLIVACATRTSAARTWTDRGGRQLEAAYVSFHGGMVRIERERDGKVFDVPLDRFSNADQAFVQAQIDQELRTRGPQPAAESDERTVAAARRCLEVLDTMEGVDLVRATTGRFFGPTRTQPASAISAKFQLAADAVTVRAQAGKEAESGADTDTITDHMGAGAEVIVAAAKDHGKSITSNKAFRMAGIGMTCFLLTRNGGPEARDAYEALLRQILDGMAPIGAAAEKHGKVVRFSETFGMAAMAMACHLRTREPGIETARSYEQLVADILPGVEPILNRAERDGKRVRYADAFGMAAIAMACHLATGDPEVKTTGPYRQLVADVLAGMDAVLRQAEKEGKVFSYPEAFGMAAMGMACHRLTQAGHAENQAEYEWLLGGLFDHTSTIISVAEEEGWRLRYSGAFSMAAKTRSVRMALSTRSAQGRRESDTSKALALLQDRTTEHLDQAEKDARELTYRDAFDLAVRETVER
jgi:hypothetical protein